jgi:hypothetical protein
MSEKKNIFRTLHIIHTLCLDDDYINEINPISKEIIETIIDNFKESYSKIKKIIINHQPNIQLLIYSNELTEIKEKQYEVNHIVNSSDIYVNLKQLSEINFKIFKDLYNTAKNKWKDFDMNQMRNFKAIRISNRCICNTNIEDNIILFHKTKNLNIIIGNVCIDTFEWLIDTPTDEIAPSDFKKWKEKFFKALKLMKESIDGKDKDDKSILKHYGKSSIVIDKMRIDRVLNDTELDIFDKYDSFKINNKFTFENFNDFQIVSESFKKIFNSYFPNNVESLLNYDVNELIFNPNIKFNMDVYKGFIEYFINENPGNFHKLEINNIIKFVEKDGERFPLFIPDLKEQKTKKCYIHIISLDIEHGFINYEFIEKNKVIQCKGCNQFEIVEINEGWKNYCKPCYFFEKNGVKKEKRYNEYIPTILMKEDKLQKINCEECYTEIEYDITRKCPIPYLTIKCDGCK